MKASVVESIRHAVDIVQVIGEVVPLKKKTGANYWGLCPFHGEKTASFSVNSQKQLFHCFGCKKGGDVFHFVQSYYRWDFTQALEELGRRAGIQVDAFKSDPHWEEGFKILEFVGEVFERNLNLKAAERFQEYLENRHIPEKLWKEFRIGAHLGGIRDLTDALHKKGWAGETAVQLGLLGRTQRGDYIDRFQGRLMFPILDERGRIRGFGGRTLANEEPKYINSPKSGHFDKGRLFYGMHLAHSSIAKKEYAVLCEGYLDVIALHEYGVTNAIGSMGTALTADQIRLLKRWTQKVVSLYDADRAGLIATERNLGNFFREGIEAKVVILPNAKDPDSYLHDQKLSQAARKSGLKKAFDDSKLAIDYLVENQVLIEKNAMARGQKLRALVNLLDQIPDEIERTLVKKDLAQRFELPEEMLSPHLAAAQKPAVYSPSPSAIGTGRKAAVKEVEKAEKALVKFLVQYGERGEFSLTSALPYLSSSEPQNLLPWTGICRYLASLSLKSEAIAKLEWLNSLNLEDGDEEAKATIREWALNEAMAPMDAEADLNRIWMDLLQGLRRSYFQLESDRLQRELHQAEIEKNEAKARELLAEKRDLANLMRLETNPSRANP